mgnify:CR=1 FL=1
MTQASWKDIAELIGISAIVASLVFVGLEMRQSQEIAVAAQYHERASLAVDWLHEQHETGDPMVWAGVCSPGVSASATTEKIERAGHGCLNLISFMTIQDNHLYQYQLGFLDEESWQARRETLKRFLGNPITAALVLDERVNFRRSFIELCEELVQEIRLETSND